MLPNCFQLCQPGFPSFPANQQGTTQWHQGQHWPGHSGSAPGLYSFVPTACAYARETACLVELSCSFTPPLPRQENKPLVMDGWVTHVSGNKQCLLVAAGYMPPGTPDHCPVDNLGQKWRARSKPTSSIQISSKPTALQNGRLNL